MTGTGTGTGDIRASLPCMLDVVYVLIVESQLYGLRGVVLGVVREVSERACFITQIRL